MDQAYDAILNKSTKEFIGNHPIDEEFLSWFTGNYGIEQLEKIASYAQLDDGEIWYEITGTVSMFCGMIIVWRLGSSSMPMTRRILKSVRMQIVSCWILPVIFLWLRAWGRQTIITVWG